jgi:threonine dehydrogenase-like Zn-dependent dehydrogenase
MRLPNFYDELTKRTDKRGPDSCIETGQTHVQAYTKPLLKLIEDGEIDPSFVVTHPASLEDAPAIYKKFRDKEDGAIKVMLRLGG